MSRVQAEPVLRDNDCGVDVDPAQVSISSRMWKVIKHVGTPMTSTKVACVTGSLCMLAIIIAFWQIASTPTVVHPRAVTILGLASVGVFASLVVFTGAQLIGARRCR